MRLTAFTEYALLVLVYLARHPGRFVTIAEIASSRGLSGNHLMKVVQHLAASGDVVTLRGPHGGLRLARPAAAIPVGDVVRQTEPKHAAAGGAQCGLASLLDQAMAAFMGVLDACSVADLAAATPPEASPDGHLHLPT